MLRTKDAKAYKDRSAGIYETPTIRLYICPILFHSICSCCSRRELTSSDGKFAWIIHIHERLLF